MFEMAVSTDPLTESNCYILTEEKRCILIDPGEASLLLHSLKKKNGNRS